MESLCECGIEPPNSISHRFRVNKCDIFLSSGTLAYEGLKYITLCFPSLFMRSVYDFVTINLIGLATYQIYLILLQREQLIVGACCGISRLNSRFLGFSFYVLRECC